MSILDTAVAAQASDHFASCDALDYIVTRPVTPKYVMGTNPDDGVITYDEYQVRQSVDAGIPQVVIQHAADGYRYRVVGALDSEPVGDETYVEFADAKAVRDRINAQLREQAKRPVDKTDAPPAAYAHAIEHPTFDVTEARCGHYLVVTSGSAEAADGIHHTGIEGAERAAAVLNAVKAVFAMAPVSHRLTQTQPHPRAIKDRARNVYGVQDATDDEVRAAVLVVMA